MANLEPLAFNPANVEDMGDGFKVIPPCTVPVVIVESDVTDTKDGTGKMLVLKYQILEGPNVGDTITDRLNIQNKSDVAQKMGMSQLKNICDAIGFAGQLKDSNQLHGKPLSVKVVIEPFKNKDGKVLDSNKIEKRMARTAVLVGAMPPPPVAAAQTTTAPVSRPWG
jgi:hypothetical protein